MRLIHVVVEDDIRTGYADRFAVNTHEEVDAYTPTNVQQRTVEQLIADKLNDQSYKLTSHINPKLYHLFAEERDLLYDECMNIDITTDQVKTKLVGLKVKLYQVISDHNISDNGDINLITGE